MSKWIQCLVFSLWMACGPAFSIVSENQIELFTVHYPPYTIIDPQNNISGIDVEVIRAAFATVGIDVSFTAAPWKRILKNLEHGRIAGTFTCAKQPDRERYMLFSDQLSETNQVAMMTINAKTQRLRQHNELSRFSVTVVEGWSIEQELTQLNIAHATTPSVDSGIKAVVYRNVDLFYNSELVTRYHARQLNLQDKIKIIRFDDQKSTPFYLCLSQRYPDSPNLIKQFNTGLRIIKETGEFDAIYDKYL